MVISAVQLVVTAPQIFQFFFGPTLVIEGYATGVESNGPYTGILTVKNTGWSPATKVEIGITTNTKSDIKLMPEIGMNIVSHNKDDIFPTHRIELERLLPNETLTIYIADYGKDDSAAQIMRSMYKVLNSLPNGNRPERKRDRTSTLPYVDFVRSSEGAWEAPVLKLTPKNPYSEIFKSKAESNHSPQTNSNPN